MTRELLYTVPIYAILAVLALTSLPGLALAVVWLSVGLSLVLSTRSRGLLADLSFVATWPLYVVLNR